VRGRVGDFGAARSSIRRRELCSRRPIKQYRKQ
jgi:hypothetical protein